MSKRHKIEQYYSVSVRTGNKNVVIDTNGWDGCVKNLVEMINEATQKKWEKVNVLKYTQNIDVYKNLGSRVVSKKRSLLKVARVGSGSLCTKVDENFMRDGTIPQNILAFFGENQR